jgi:hypothetical protein
MHCSMRIKGLLTLDHTGTYLHCPLLTQHSLYRYSFLSLLFETPDHPWLTTGSSLLGTRLVLFSVRLASSALLFLLPTPISSSVKHSFHCYSLPALTLKLLERNTFTNFDSSTFSQIWLTSAPRPATSSWL